MTELALRRRIEGVVGKASERDVDRRFADPGRRVDHEIVVLSIRAEQGFSGLDEDSALIRPIRGERKHPVDRRLPNYHRIVRAHRLTHSVTILTISAPTE